jgi:hypothetical protein
MGRLCWWEWREGVNEGVKKVVSGIRFYRGCLFMIK